MMAIAPFLSAKSLKPKVFSDSVGTLLASLGAARWSSFAHLRLHFAFGTYYICRLFGRRSSRHPVEPSAVAIPNRPMPVDSRHLTPAARRLAATE